MEWGETVPGLLIPWSNFKIGAQRVNVLVSSMWFWRMGKVSWETRRHLHKHDLPSRRSRYMFIENKNVKYQKKKLILAPKIFSF